MFTNYQRLISTSLLRCGFYSLSAHRSTPPIMKSQFHKKGLPRFEAKENYLWKKSLQIQKNETLIKLQQKLQRLRQVLGQGSDMQLVNKYVATSQQLSEFIGRLPSKNYYVWKIIAWYNLIDFHRQIIIELLRSEKKEELQHFISCLSWMDHKWQNDYGYMDQDLILGPIVKQFYNALIKFDLTVSQLQSIESLVCTQNYVQKRKFFQRYVAQNLQKELKSAQPTQLDELIWLIYAYTISMNDDEPPLSLVENYLLQHKPQLTPVSIQRLKNIYQLRGRINKQVYAQIIRPYIFKHNLGTLRQLGETIKFVVCSECEDYALLKTAYELVDNLPIRVKEQQSTFRLLHVYTHYLMIKGFSIRLNKVFGNTLLSNCRRKAESRKNVSSSVLAKLQQNPSHGKYVSPCLSLGLPTVIEQDSSKTTSYEKMFLQKLRSTNPEKYEFKQKPIFCGFQIDFWVREKESGEMHGLEIEGIQYVFNSGRYIRQRQIRDQIMKHYGIRVHHIDYLFIKMKEFSDLEGFFTAVNSKAPS